MACFLPPYVGQKVSDIVYSLEYSTSSFEYFQQQRNKYDTHSHCEWVPESQQRLSCLESLRCYNSRAHRISRVMRPASHVSGKFQGHLRTVEDNLSPAFPPVRSKSLSRALLTERRCWYVEPFTRAVIFEKAPCDVIIMRFTSLSISARVQ